MTRLYTTLLLGFGALWLLTTDVPGANPQGSAHAAAPALRSAEPLVPADRQSERAEVSISALLGVLGFSGLALFNLHLRRVEPARQRAPVPLDRR